MENLFLHQTDNYQHQLIIHIDFSLQMGNIFLHKDNPKTKRVYSNRNNYYRNVIKKKKDELVLFCISRMHDFASV